MYTEFYWWDIANVHFVAIGLIGIAWGYSLKYLVDTGMKTIRKKQRTLQRQQEHQAYHTQYIQRELAAIQQYRLAARATMLNSSTPSHGYGVALEYQGYNKHSG